MRIIKRWKREGYFSHFRALQLIDIKMRTTIAFILLLSTVGKVQGQIIENPKTNVIDSLLIACHNQGLFNGVALISDGGKIILHKPY